MKRGFAAGIDVGGTHTDLVLFDERTRQIHVAKTATSVDDPALACVANLSALCKREKIEATAIRHFMHGTTVATNIALEHNGAKVGLITTEGFRDILHIARHKRPQTFSLQLDLPWQKHPLVPRRRRLTVGERIVPPGEVLVPLDEAAVRAAVRFFLDQQIEAVAVCFLHAYLNPVHEVRTGEILAEMAPDMHVSLSHRVVPQYREYERFSTTALNAYVGPKVSRYLRRLDGALKDAGVPAPLRLMQSSGGAATLQAAQIRPVSLLMSGPAGGLVGGIWVGKSAGFANVITLDVGGTSADIGVAPGGELLFKHILDSRLGDYHAMVPMAELDAIGAGGGSVAYVDSGGQFQVGPRSAGADPGPACYGRGGVEPTATDCMVALGWIDPENFLGGTAKLDRDLAVAAINEMLVSRLGGTVEDAALGAIRILTHSMVQACEINSVRRGYDPREFALVAFGGAGPLFACEIAREMGIRHVVIPPMPGLTSALGLLASDISYELGRTVMASEGEEDRAKLSEAFCAIETELRDQLRHEGFDHGEIVAERHADCRYQGQGYELRTPAPDGTFDGKNWTALRNAFDDVHQRQYGKNFPDRPIRVVNARVTARISIGLLEPARPGKSDGPDPAPAVTAVRDAVFLVDGKAQKLEVQRLRRDLLKAGHRIGGPAIVDQMDTTTVIAADFLGVVDDCGNLVLSRGETE